MFWRRFVVWGQVCSKLWKAWRQAGQMVTDLTVTGAYSEPKTL